MSDKIFVDSNIFLYTLDRNDPKKRESSKHALHNAAQNSRLFISTQVLNEIFAVATRKLGVNNVAAKEYVRTLQQLDLILISPEIINNAMDYAILDQINYWDALTIAAAEAGRCSMLWSEGFQAGRSFRGIKIVNPLTE